MTKVSLVILAAGIGSRFGGGIKQLEPVGPNGEIIMDYSIYDAIEAGFNKVVFVIRKDIENDFKEIIGKRIEKIVEVEYVYQSLEAIPEKFRTKGAGRTKPWGTGQAILCCKDVVCEPFLVINADDYYGKEAYRVAYQHLIRTEKKENSLDICMVGFELENTLSENGTVTRGVCKVNRESMLTEIEETYGVKASGDRIIAEKDGNEITIPVDTKVSMNMWGCPAEFISFLEQRFLDFLEHLKEEDKKSEFLLPRIIGEMLQDGEIQVKVLESSDRWFGVTYKEDKEDVVNSIKGLIEEKIYPEKLF